MKCLLKLEMDINKLLHDLSLQVTTQCASGLETMLFPGALTIHDSLTTWLLHSACSLFIFWFPVRVFHPPYFHYFVFLLLNRWRHCFFSCIFHFHYVHMKRNVLVARNHIWKITLAIAFVVSALSAFITIKSLWWSYDKGKCLSIHSLGNDDFLSCLLTFTNWKYVMEAFTWLLSWCRIWHAWNRKCNKINWHEIKLFSWKL